MLYLVDWIFIGAGAVFGAFLVTVIVLIVSVSRKPAQATQRHEPMVAPESYYSVSSPWDASMNYEGFTGIVHVHGVKNGDTFRAVITDANSKCKMEKLIRVRS